MTLKAKAQARAAAIIEVLERNPANPRGRMSKNPNGYIDEDTYKIQQQISEDQTLFDKIETAFERRAFSRTILSGLVVGFVLIFVRAIFGI